MKSEDTQRIADECVMGIVGEGGCENERRDKDVHSRDTE